MRLEIGIIALVEEVLGVPAERRAQFDWLINKPSQHISVNTIRELLISLRKWTVIGRAYPKKQTDT